MCHSLKAHQTAVPHLQLESASQPALHIAAHAIDVCMCNPLRCRCRTSPDAELEILFTGIIVDGNLIGHCQLFNLEAQEARQYACREHQ